MVTLEQKKEVVSPYPDTVKCPNCLSIFSSFVDFKCGYYSSGTTARFNTLYPINSYDKTGKCPFCEKRF